MLTFDLSAVERDTGLTKDVLRMWEKRYGFPSPSRNASGERVYPIEQVERLRLLKRLMDMGIRPGTIVGRGLEELAALVAERGPSLAVSAELRDEVQCVLDAITAFDTVRTRAELRRLQAQSGLPRFVAEIVPALNRLVGDMAQHDAGLVYAEHFYSEQIQETLRRAISDLQIGPRETRILLTTLPGEYHLIGLLMVEAILTLERAECVFLGSDTPVDRIVKAASEHNFEIVALSFSSHCSRNSVVKGLRDLRKLLPETISVWAGGDGIKGMKIRINGIVMPMTLSSVSKELAKHRQSTRI